MDQDPAVIKLPLFSRTSKLAAIPGQPEGVTYGVVLRAVAIPVAPTERTLDVLAQVAVGLTDAGVPMLAHEAVWFMGRHLRGSDVFDSLAASLRAG